jgi:hypothetical protein
MESIGELLGKYNPQRPDDVMAVKRYITETYDAPVSVAVHGEQALTVTVTSAALANTLRLRARAIQKAAGTTKRLIFRIG